MLRIEQNTRNSIKVAAWAGSRHVADLHRERDACRAKLLGYPLPLMTSEELQHHIDTCAAIKAALDAWK